MSGSPKEARRRGMFCITRGSNTPDSRPLRLLESLSIELTACSTSSDREAAFTKTIDELFHLPLRDLTTTSMQRLMDLLHTYGFELKFSRREKSCVIRSFE